MKSGLASSSQSRPRRKQKLTPLQLADLKSKSICRRCKQKGHWAADVDKCPKFNFFSSSEMDSHDNLSGSSASAQIQSGSAKQNKSVTFNMATLHNGHDYVPNVGPVVDYGAPYSGMGLVEFYALYPSICPGWKERLDPIPQYLTQLQTDHIGNLEVDHMQARFVELLDLFC